MKNGISAGNIKYYCHIHLIPDRDGDIDHPRGGVRHILPGGDFIVLLNE